MKHKKAIILSLIFLMLCAVFYFTFPNIKEKEPINVIYISKVLDFNNDFWTQLIEGLNMASEDYDVKLSVVGPPSESDIERQNELIEWAIEKKPDVILLAPCQYEGSCEMAQKIVNNGISLVLVDSNLEQSIAKTYISTDNVEAGNKQGTYLYDSVSNQSRIGIVAHEQHSSTAMERIEGLKKGLKEKSSLITEITYSGSDYASSQENTKKLLIEHPELNVLVCTNEYTTVGAAMAIQELGLEDQIFLVGFDSSIKELQLLEEGLIKATVIQQAFKMGYYSVEAAVTIANGKPVKNHINSGSMLITNENMYDDDIQKILFPFQ